MKRLLSLSLLLALLLGLSATGVSAHCASRTVCGRAAVHHNAAAPCNTWCDTDNDGWCDNCSRQHAPKPAAPCNTWCDADSDGFCDTCHFQHAPKAAAPANAGHHGNGHHGGHHG